MMKKNIKNVVIGVLCGAVFAACLTACSVENFKVNEETVGTGPSLLEKEAVGMVVDGATQGLSE